MALQAEPGVHCGLTGPAVQVGQLVTVVQPGDVQQAAELHNAQGYVVVVPADWHIIPAENLVAAFQVLSKTRQDKTRVTPVPASQADDGVRPDQVMT